MFLIVILSEGYLQNLEHKAISEVFHITPKTVYGRIRRSPQIVKIS